jgi:transcriptional regulator with XRE-family HTH domain
MFYGDFTYICRKDITMDTIERLVQERRMKHVTQKEIADMLNITTSTLWRYETRQRDISLDLAIKYAEIVGFELKLILKE